eukprot:837680_1
MATEATEAKMLEMAQNSEKTETKATTNGEQQPRALSLQATRKTTSTRNIATFEDADIKTIFRLSHGLRSKMTNKEKEVIADRLFTINYRCCVVIFISLFIVIMDYQFNSNWAVTFVFLIVELILVGCALFCQIRNKTLIEKKQVPWYYVTSEKIDRDNLEWKIFHVLDDFNSAYVTLKEVQKKEKLNNIMPGKHRYKSFTYDNAMNWFLDIRNTMGVVGHWIGWILPVAGILLLFGQTVIHVFFPDKPIGSFCDDTSAADTYTYGECLIKDEWGQTLSIVCLVCGSLGLLTLRDLTPFATDYIRMAQEHLRDKYGFSGECKCECGCQYHPGARGCECECKCKCDPYYATLKRNRDRRAKFTYPVFIICFVLYVIALSLHALWFHLFTDWERPFYEINQLDKEDGLRTFMIGFYAYNVIVFGCTFGLWYVMVYWMYLPFADYFYICSALSDPVFVLKPDSQTRVIEKWWYIRKFYHDYVMPVYYRWGEINYFSLMVGSIIAWALLLIWASKPGFVFGFNEVVVVSVGVTWPAIIFVFSWKISGSERTHKHSQMLVMQKHQLMFKYDKGQMNEELLPMLDTLLEAMEKYDYPLKIMGVEMTHEKMVAFFVYIIAMAVTVIFEVT